MKENKRYKRLKTSKWISIRKLVPGLLLTVISAGNWLPTAVRDTAHYDAKRIERSTLEKLTNFLFFLLYNPLLLQCIFLQDGEFVCVTRNKKFSNMLCKGKNSPRKSKKHFLFLEATFRFVLRNSCLEKKFYIAIESDLILNSQQFLGCFVQILHRHRP